MKAFQKNDPSWAGMIPGVPREQPRGEKGLKLVTLMMSKRCDGDHASIREYGSPRKYIHRLVDIEEVICGRRFSNVPAFLVASMLSSVVAVAVAVAIAWPSELRLHEVRDESLVVEKISKSILFCRRL
jgi:hypothetical protein